MAVKRANPILKEPIIAEHDDIEAFTVQVHAGILHIVVAHGNWVGKKFNKISSETVTLTGTDFYKMATAIPENPSDNFFVNLKGILWKVLMEKGVVEGEIV